MKKVYKLEDLDCAVCGQKMEDAAKKVEGVNDVVVSFMAQKMTVDFKDGADVESVMNEIAKICKKIEPDCIIKR